MFVWDTTTGGQLVPWFTDSCQLILSPELQSTIRFDPGFTATSIFHPATYLNKVAVASAQGSIQLWNIKTQSVRLFMSIFVFI